MNAISLVKIPLFLLIILLSHSCEDREKLVTSQEKNDILTSLEKEDTIFLRSSSEKEGNDTSLNIVLFYKGIKYDDLSKLISEHPKTELKKVYILEKMTDDRQKLIRNFLEQHLGDNLNMGQVSSRPGPADKDFQPQLPSSRYPSDFINDYPAEDLETSTQKQSLSLKEGSYDLEDKESSSIENLKTIVTPTEEANHQTSSK